jgi:nucleoid-associated protein YgaU
VGRTARLGIMCLMALAIGLARLVEVELDPGAPPALAIAPPAAAPIIDESPASTTSTAPGDAAPVAGPPAPVAKVDDSRSYVVKAGETLGMISQKVYGTTKHWKALHEANRDVIPDPARMRAGTKLKLPRINGR